MKHIGLAFSEHADDIPFALLALVVASAVFLVVYFRSRRQQQHENNRTVHAVEPEVPSSPKTPSPKFLELVLARKAIIFWRDKTLRDIYQRLQDGISTLHKRLDDEIESISLLEAISPSGFAKERLEPIIRGWCTSQERDIRFNVQNELVSLCIEHASALQRISIPSAQELDIIIPMKDMPSFHVVVERDLISTTISVLTLAPRSLGKRKLQAAIKKLTTEKIIFSRHGPSLMTNLHRGIEEACSNLLSELTGASKHSL